MTEISASAAAVAGVAPRDTQTLVLPVDGKSSFSLGQGFDQVAASFRGQAVANQNTQPAGGSQSTYTLQLVTSSRSLRESLSASAAARFSGVFGATANDRTTFVAQSQVNQYYAHLLVRCSVVNAGTALTSYDYTSQAIAQIPNLDPFYAAFGDLFCRTSWTGGELLGLITFCTDDDDTRDKVTSEINVAAGSWNAEASFQAALEAVTSDVRTTINFYQSPQPQEPVPATIAEVINAARNFSSFVQSYTPAVPCAFEAVDYAVVTPPQNQPVFKGPSTTNARRGLARYATVQEQLLDISSDLAYIAAHPSLFPLSAAQLKELQGKASNLGREIEDGVQILAQNVLQASANVGVDLMNAVGNLVEEVPLRTTKTTWILSQATLFPGAPTSADGPGLAAVTDTLYFAYRGNSSSIPDQDGGTMTLAYTQLADDGPLSAWTAPQAFDAGTPSNFQSASGPRLVDFDDVLWCAHRGAADDNLWITQFNPQDVVWVKDAPLGNGEHLSQCSPALAVFGENTLFCAHRGNQGDNDQRLWYATITAPSGTWSADAPFSSATNDDTTNKFRSAAAPALAFHADALHCVFRGPDDSATGGVDDQHLYWTSRASLTAAWTAPQLLPSSSSSAGPALVEVDDTLLCVYSGPLGDTTLHYAVLSAEGVWSADANLSTAFGTSRPPALAVFELSGIPTIVAAWRGAGSDNRLYYGVVK